MTLIYNEEILTETAQKWVSFIGSISYGFMVWMFMRGYQFSLAEIHMATCHGSLYQTDNFIKYLGK